MDAINLKVDADSAGLEPDSAVYLEFKSAAQQLWQDHCLYASTDEVVSWAQELVI